jgi:transcriptional regulator with XRE-family HTH domain
MPEIGTTLREARMRQRIDISEVEAETKIRAKYLRALENEEWNLLPGPTYVKSFLRTYADALGLDGRLILEEYKLRHERLSDLELQPISPPRVREGDRRRRQARGIPRGWIVAIVVLALLAALFALGKSSSHGQAGASSHAPARAASTTSAGRTSSNGATATAGGATLRLQVVPTGPVYVCLQDAAGKRLLDGAVLHPGAGQRTFRSTRFRLTLGNGNARLRINGRTRSVPAVGSGIGYEITSHGPRRVLSAAERPTCAG